MNKPKKILLSGIQPTGRPHVGNYFGAMRQFVDFQDKYSSFVFIADYHALTTIQDKDVLKKNIFDLTLDYLAVGLDPEKVNLYRQSSVPQVTELMWVFSTLITVPFLERAHAFKDKTAKGIEATVGLFNYPVLMAADILLPLADVVPVGEDQRQHVEIAREIARKFNNTYGETFKEPQEILQENSSIIPGTDGQKMSKSYKNDIPLFATDEVIDEKVLSIKTDSTPIEEPKDPEKDNVFALHKHFTAGEELEEVRNGYINGGLGHVDSKRILAKNIKLFVAPLRERRNEIQKDKDYVLGVLEKGGENARLNMEGTMKIVRDRVGLKLS